MFNFTKIKKKKSNLVSGPIFKSAKFAYHVNSKYINIEPVCVFFRPFKAVLTKHCTDCFSVSNPAGESLSDMV